MGLSQDMISEHGVLLNIIRLKQEGSDGIVDQGEQKQNKGDKKISESEKMWEIRMWSE